jgi:putative transcriptional regulator
MAVKVLLQEVRKSRGLSQNDLARLSQMSPQNIQKIEQGDAKSMTFATLGRFCKILKCQPGDLLIYEDDPDTTGLQEVILVQKSIPSKSGKKVRNSSSKRPQQHSLFALIPDLAESA